ncbi:hypothetical protein N0Q04_002818 [Salmonella enterica]|nr:hypothetical protein [Salmonella enterica]EGT7590858.1 hypothetical protein [Salmonella enterica]EHW0273061.1 hypothetical protein [Salmonella enterica]EIA3912570.1 hypothetical protein [Salmonella enterica]EID3570906.1 hypothetical protein [Salmonella enterica]
MATLRSNTLVKIIIPVVALGAVAIGIRACSDKRVQQEAAVTIPGSCFNRRAGGSGTG